MTIERPLQRLPDGLAAGVRILHVLDHSLPLHSGYTFRTRAIMRATKAMGLEVAGVTGVRQAAASSAQWSADAESVDGLRFFRTPPAHGPKAPVLSEIAEIRALERRIDALVDEWRPDVLHAHSPVLDALAAARVARRRGLPFVYEIRAFWEDAAVGNGTGREGSLRYHATRALETWACRRADTVAVICEGLRADLIARGISAEKIFVSPNGVDLDQFGTPAAYDSALAAELGLPADAETIGFIGSFYAYEGIDDLIAAMPALVAARPQAHLLLVGGGPMEAELHAQAEASPVADRIRFAGRVAHDQVERFYGLIDILTYPRKAMRLTELVTPLKPLEAMAQGKLVAASNVGGHRELIEDGVTGTLFEPGKPAAIADALAHLFAARGMWELRRTTARAFVERERNWSLNIARYRPVYQNLTQKRVAPAAKVESARAATGKQMTVRKALMTASKAPIEAPLGLLLGGAWAFAVLAMPAPLFSRVFLSEPLLGPRLAVAVVLGIVAGLGAWLLLKRLGTPKVRTPGGVPTLRRADAHPDAPPRRPIFATQDLGMPLMDVAISAPPAPARRRAPVAIPAIADEPLELTDRVGDDDVRANPTIMALMDRLKAGLERRAAAGLAAAPSASDPSVRAAVTELGRLARRR